MLPDCGDGNATDFAASSARLSASAVETSGFGAPLRTHSPDPGAREIDTRADDLAVADQLVDLALLSLRKTSIRLTRLDARDQQHAGGRVAGANGVAAVAPLERRQQFVGRRLDRGREESVDLGGVGCHWRHHHHGAGENGGPGGTVDIAPSRRHRLLELETDFLQPLQGGLAHIPVAIFSGEARRMARSDRPAPAVSGTIITNKRPVSLETLRKLPGSRRAAPKSRICRARSRHQRVLAVIAPGDLEAARKAHGNSRLRVEMAMQPRPVTGLHSAMLTIRLRGPR